MVVTTSRQARALMPLVTMAMLLVAIPPPSHGDDAAALHGGGSTLVDPVMRKWIAE